MKKYFNEYGSEHASLQKDIMKIFNENDLTYSLRQGRARPILFNHHLLLMETQIEKFCASQIMAHVI